MPNPAPSLEDALDELKRLANVGKQATHVVREADAEAALLALTEPDNRVAAAEARFQALVEQIPAVTFSASFASGLKELYVSPQIEEVMGYTQAEWRESPVLWYERLHPDDKGRWNREFSQTIAFGSDFKAVYRFLSKDGRVVWLHGEARIVRDAAQRPLWLQGVGFDVTDVYEAQARIRAAEVRAKEQLELQVQDRTRELVAYRHLVDSSTNAIASVRLDGCIDLWNARASELFGLLPNDRGTRRFAELFASCDGAAAARLQQAISTGSACMVSTAWRSRFDTTLDLSISISPILDDEQTLRGMSAIIRDETENLRAAKQFELAVEAAPNAMITVDAAGQISLVNSEAERLFGYQRVELVGQGIQILVPESVRDRHPALRAAFAAAPRARAMGQGRDLRARRKDGTEFPVEIGLNPIETPAGLQVLCAVVDISERKRAEQVIFAANAALRAKTAEMEQFVYTVSHDLKSPLVTMGTFIDILREDLTSGDLVSAEDAMGRVSKACARMHALISDLLELSRVGNVEAEITEVCLSELIASVLEVSAAQLTAAGIEVVCSAALPTLRGERDHLFQVFENLISNAAKYATGVPEPRLAISCEMREADLLIKLADNGPGIPAAHRERVFKLFHRLHPRTTTGTGVGLTIVARIMERHGGRVWVEAAESSGACFVLAFPANCVVKR